jgi:Rrf2 family protein
MFTKDTEYAVIVVQELKSVEDATKPVSLQSIVKKNELKQGFAEQVCRRLRNAGYIRSVKGPGGGYYITQDGTNATVWDVMYAVETRLKNKIEKLLPQTKDIFFNCERKLKEVYIKGYQNNSDNVA